MQAAQLEPEPEPEPNAEEGEPPEAAVLAAEDEFLSGETNCFFWRGVKAPIGTGAYQVVDKLLTNSKGARLPVTEPKPPMQDPRDSLCRRDASAPRRRLQRDVLLS